MSRGLVKYFIPYVFLMILGYFIDANLKTGSWIDVYIDLAVYSMLSLILFLYTMYIIVHVVWRVEDIEDEEV